MVEIKVEESPQKVQKEIPGKMEFIDHVMREALKKTNEQLSKMNYSSFQELRRKQNNSPEQFQTAFQLLNSNLTSHLLKIAKEIIEGLEAIIKT